MAFRDLPACCLGHCGDSGRGRPGAGPLEAFDAVLEALGARELCLRWGDAPQRPGQSRTVARSRRHLRRLCAAEGQAAPWPGLVTHLLALAEAGEERAGRAERAAMPSP